MYNRNCDTASAQRKTFLCRGKNSVGLREEMSWLDGAHTELSIMTPLKYVGSRENQKQLPF